MTANQIIIPLTLLAFAIFVCVLLIRKRRENKPPKGHTAQSPQAENDKGAILRSEMSGYTGESR